MSALPTDLPGLSRTLRTGKLSLETLLADLEARMERAEPALSAMLPEPERFARLRVQAKALAARHPDPAGRPALYGVPVAVKDIMHVDGLPTRAGSSLPPEELAGPQGDLVDRLLRAGALVLGKSHTTEFAHFSPAPTKNPRNPAHTPGGSSSGSAAAVAAGYCPLGLGTQTMGSVIRPASFCGVTGFKPSRGRLPGDGMVNFSKSVDQAGFFTTDMAGALLAADALCTDWRGVNQRHEPGALAVVEGPLANLVDPDAQAVFRRAVERLQDRGWRVRSVPLFADLERIRALHKALTAAEMAQAHADRYPRHAKRYSPQTRILIEEGRMVDETTLETAKRSMTGLRASLNGLLVDGGFDAFICPSTLGPAPLGLSSTGDPVMNLPWTHAGLPALTLPAGQLGGLPLGLQAIGRFGGDESLLATGLTLERALLFFAP